jgi:putative Ca2+/H+ antiporter (TMEM165/GDT1 family)
MDIQVLAAAFGAVFIVELLGDKSLYTIGSLASRFRPLPLFCGITIAFMGKMLVAVTLGRFIAMLPESLVVALSVATFVGTALFLWFKRPEESPTKPLEDVNWSPAVGISFAAIFFSEWADIGQITAATLSARTDAPLEVWLGATLALMAKGVIGLTLGIGLRRFVPRDVLRYGAVGLCLVMALLAALRMGE